MNTLHWLHGKPTGSGRIKSYPEDFIVCEDLGFLPDGEGEHILVQVRKRGCNTRFVADALARFCRIPLRDASFAGQKDRHALAQQWFSLRLPGNATVDFSGFQADGCQILQHARHRRKLRPGSLRGNHFTLIVRHISQHDEAEQRLGLIQCAGVPNYFGEQRFGYNGNNLTQAYQWAKTDQPPRQRQQRAFALSAARSALFNHIVSQRLQTANFHQVITGDALQLAGRGSWFVAQADELSILQQRLEQQEICLTAPLPGYGNWGSEQQALEFEQHCLADKQALVDLLTRQKVEAARRAIRLIPGNLHWQWQDSSTLKLQFWLPAGSFATSLIRELCHTESSDSE